MKQGPEVPNAYYRVSVKALIINDDKILAVNERGTGWDLPGGGIEWGESPVDALHRELREEIGCAAKIEERPIIIVPASTFSHNQHALLIVYRAFVNPDEVQATGHVEAVQFIRIAEFKRNEESCEVGWESPLDFWGEIEKFL